MLESLTIQFKNNVKYQETMLKALSDGNNAQEAQLMQVSAQGCVKCGSPHCGERCLETIADEEARIKAAVQERLAQRLQAIAEEEATIKENHGAISLEEHDKELQIEEKETCDLIGKKSLIPLALEEDEEVEAPKEASEVVIELECEKMVDEREEQVVECAELKVVSIVDFVFGDKLMIDEEKPPSIRIYLMNSWSKGVQGKEQE